MGDGGGSRCQAMARDIQKEPHRYRVGVKTPHPIHVVRFGEAPWEGNWVATWCEDPSALVGRTKADADSEKRLTW